MATKSVTVNIPGQPAPITVQNVPTNLSEDEFRTQFRQRHPEYFGGKPEATKPTADDLSQMAGAVKRMPPPDEGFWKSFGRQAGGFAEGTADLLSGKAMVPNPAAAASLVNTFTTAGKQYANPLDPNTGLPITITPEMRNLHLAAALGAPLGGQSLETGLEQFESGNVKGALGTGAGMTAGLAMSKLMEPETASLAVRQAKSQLRLMTKQQILEQAHAKLNSQVEPTNQLIRDVPLAGMRREVGQHVQGLDAGDVSASPGNRPQVSTTSLHPLIDDITNSHRSAVYSPRFQQAVEEVNNLPAQAYWKDVHDSKMNVRSLWAKAAEGSPEKSALNKLSNGLEDILANRAEEIGQTKQYNKYRELTQAYHSYESSDNVIGKLLNTSLGNDYFKLLRDPAYADQISAASKDFAKYGLPQDTLSNLAKNNTQLHDFVQTTKGGGFRGKIASIMQEPLAAGAGMLGGRALGAALGFPTLGGLVGAMKGAEFAETAGARRVLAEQGLAPSREMIGPSVEPGPAGPGAAQIRKGGPTSGPAAPTVNSGDVKDLTSMLLDQFPKMDKQAAATQAKAALEQSGGDVGKATEQLIRQRGLAQKIEKLPPVSGGSQGADLKGFANRVKQIAQSLPDTKMPSGSTHQGRVAISEIYDAYGRDYPDAGSLASFKDRLVKAAKDRHISLSRADMPEYLDYDIRQRSASKWGNDDVHFVDTRQRATSSQGTDLKSFADKVNTAANEMQGSGVHRYGIGDKVFISEIYDRLKPELGDMTLDQFKQKIEQARQKVLVQPSAADQAPLYPKTHQIMNARSKTGGDNSVSFIDAQGKK